MRSSSAKLLSLLSRHAVEQQLASTEAGASLHSLLRRGSGQLCQQARNSSTAKPAAPLPSPGQAPPPVQRRSYSAKPQLQKADRPWHRHERDVGGPQKQQVQRAGPKQAANGAGLEKPRFEKPRFFRERGNQAQQQQQSQPPRPPLAAAPLFEKPRFLLERAQHLKQQNAGPQQQRQQAPNGSARGPFNGDRQPRQERPSPQAHPHRQQQQQQQGRGAPRDQQQQQQQQQHRGQDRSGGGRPQLEWRKVETSSQQRQQQHAERSPGQQQRQANRSGWMRQGQQQQQQDMPWWQRQRLERQQEAAAAGQGHSAAQQQQQQGRRGQQQQPAHAAEPAGEAAPEEVHIPAEVSLIRLAALLGTSVEALEPVLRDLGETPSSEQDIVSPDAAELAALEFGKVALVARDSASLDADAVPRPAVVTVMGHVDHGKTTLLDALRSTSVAAQEAGGITQHIGAFEVQLPGSKQSLTFLDTPGHAAFSSMRARGAAVTDLVVLVVAADDGVMPQTLEALAHARASGCPIVVAITKCDKPAADAARVRQQLLGRGVELEEVGGNVQVVEVAATTGLGLDSLEEALLLQAELLELRASRTRRGEGVVIEAKMDRGQGPVATVVVKRGTLKVGQSVVIGTEWGKVRSLKGTGGVMVDEVLPGQPAEIAGLKGLPQAGDELLVVANEERAQRMSRSRTSKSEFHRRAAIARMLAASKAQAEAEGGEGGEAARVLPVIVKGDVQGSAEAVRDAVAGLSSEQVRVQVVHVGVGPISQSDVQLAVPLGARILGFNVRPAGAEVEALAKQHGLDIRCQRVIYHLLEEVGELVAGVAPRVAHEVVVGSAEVLQVFHLKGARGKEAGAVAGCRVTEGSIKGSLRYKVLRGGEVVFEGPCASLKRHKLDVETVGKGTECGLGLEGFDGFKLGDMLQCVDVEMRAPEVKVVGS